MHVKDIMKEEIVHVDKDQNIQDALKLMKKHKISRLPVVNMNEGHIRELVGIVTEKDISHKIRIIQIWKFTSITFPCVNCYETGSSGCSEELKILEKQQKP